MAHLQLTDVSRTYPGDVPVHALTGVTLEIGQGEYVAIEGPSGSGKSTLLNQIALLDTPTAGVYRIDGADTADLDDAGRARARSDTFAFIFQSFHLLDGRTVLDNVALGTLYRRLPARRRRELAHEALTFVGLDHKEWQRTSRLSGGERQRVAIARAIASGAPVVVADEPTGNLDRATGRQIMDTLERLNSLGTTLIVVTHDPDVAARARRRLHVLDGHVTEAGPTPGAPAAPEFPLDAPAPEGRSSSVRLADGLADAWRGLWTKARRTLALIASVALGVGLALSTAGLSSTAQAQVSALFDAQRNQRVALTTPTLSTDTPGAAPTAPLLTGDAITRLAGLAGVTAVTVFTDHQTSTVLTSPHSSEAVPKTRIIGVVDGAVPATILGVDTQGPPLARLEAGDVLIGEQVAARLNLGPLLASPAVWINGAPHRVAGVVTAAGVNADLLDAVLMPEDDAALLAPVQWARAEIRVVPGAAAQVATQAPVAWWPQAPTSLTVDAPPDPTTLRDSIESNVATMLLTLTGVALLAAVLSLTNAMTTAVFQRVGEFGLRRAIGARRIHITGLVVVESLAVGLLGGVAGAYGAVVTILAVTIARHWQPVLDPILIPAGVGGGVLVGLVGGLLATWRAARIEPSDALRA